MLTIFFWLEVVDIVPTVPTKGVRHHTADYFHVHASPFIARICWRPKKLFVEAACCLPF